MAAHLLLLYRIGPIGPMCMLGIAFASYGVVFWAGLARCLLSIVESCSSKTNMPEAGCRASDELEYGTIQLPTQLSDDRSDADGDNLPGETGEGIITLGYGIMTSLNSLSTAVVPILLAKIENAVGFTGLQVFFLILSLLGLFASVGLSWSWRI